MKNLFFVCCLILSCCGNDVEEYVPEPWFGLYDDCMAYIDTIYEWMDSCGYEHCTQDCVREAWNMGVTNHTCQFAITSIEQLMLLPAPDNCIDYRIKNSEGKVLESECCMIRGLES